MESLLDPLNDRQVPSLEAPPYKPLSDDLMWSEMDMPNWEVIRDHLKREGKITKEQVMRLWELSLNIVKKEPNLVYLAEPVWVVGDIHGQYYDLCHLIEKAGKPK
jgi:serine/threonine-protein phosphatase 2B catalytic subunit